MEGTLQPCPHCRGTGFCSTESLQLVASAASTPSKSAPPVLQDARASPTLLAPSSRSPINAFTPKSRNASISEGIVTQDSEPGTAIAAASPSLREESPLLPASASNPLGVPTSSFRVTVPLPSHLSHSAKRMSIDKSVESQTPSLAAGHHAVTGRPSPIASSQSSHSTLPLFPSPIPHTPATASTPVELSSLADKPKLPPLKQLLRGIDEWRHTAPPNAALPSQSPVSSTWPASGSTSSDQTAFRMPVPKSNGTGTTSTHGESSTAGPGSSYSGASSGASSRGQQQQRHPDRYYVGSSQAASPASAAYLPPAAVTHLSTRENGSRDSGSSHDRSLPSNMNRMHLGFSPSEEEYSDAPCCSNDDCGGLPHKTPRAGVISSPALLRNWDVDRSVLNSGDDEEAGTPHKKPRRTDPDISGASPFAASSNNGSQHNVHAEDSSSSRTMSAQHSLIELGTARPHAVRGYSTTAADYYRVRASGGDHLDNDNPALSSLDKRGADIEAAIHLAQIATRGAPDFVPPPSASSSTKYAHGTDTIRPPLSHGGHSAESEASGPRSAPSLTHESSYNDNSTESIPTISQDATADSPGPGHHNHASEAQDGSSGTGKYFCSACGKRFTRPSALAVHSHMHTGAKPFSCPICQRSFSVNSNLRRHMKTHSKEERAAVESGV